MIDLTGLPGEDLVKRGQTDLAAGEVTISAVAVSVAGDRFRSLGVDLHALPTSAAPPRQYELMLYELLLEAQVDDTYARYNALLRELDSFLEAAEGRLRRAA
ncbi:MAG: hypothetical protein JRG94_07650 [Deltaproteobacteria bacterium]|nr:hypothetical protein [Deltaproteobacteria bacterium]